VLVGPIWIVTLRVVFARPPTRRRLQTGFPTHSICFSTVVQNALELTGQNLLLAQLMRTAAGFLPLFGFAGVGVAGVGVLGGGVGGEGDLEDAIAREGADGVVGDPRKPAEDGLLVVEAFGTNLGFEPNCLFELFGGVLAEFLAAKISPCLFISNDPISNESGLGLPPLTLTTLFTLLFICGFGRRG